MRGSAAATLMVLMAASRDYQQMAVFQNKKVRIGTERRFWAHA